VIESALKRPTILVVDDSASAREAITKRVAARGEVVSVSTAEQAWEMLLLGMQPDELWVDLTLPAMSGLELIKRIRARAANAARTLTITVITGDDNLETEAIARAAGADDFLTKTHFSSSSEALVSIAAPTRAAVLSSPVEAPAIEVPPPLLLPKLPEQPAGFAIADWLAGVHLHNDPSGTVLLTKLETAPSETSAPQRAGINLNRRAVMIRQLLRKHDGVLVDEQAGLWIYLASADPIAAVRIMLRVLATVTRAADLSRHAPSVQVACRSMSTLAQTASSSAAQSLPNGRFTSEDFLPLVEGCRADLPEHFRSGRLVMTYDGQALSLPLDLARALI
jgi:CheY-like chemotaxis protein